MREHGRSYPLGARNFHDGANFSVYSRGATSVELLLFESEEDLRPERVIRLDPAVNRTYHYWHAFVQGVRPGQIYGYRADGPWDPANGMRFDASKVLLDPYGRAVAVPRGYDRNALLKKGEVAAAMKSVVVDSSDYDWEGDQPLNRPSLRTVIYELHVRGFTQHPNSGVQTVSAALTQASFRRFRIFSNSGSQRWSYFLYSTSTRKILRRDV